LILSDLCDSPEEEREFIEQANTSALKLVKLLDEILDVAKAEHGNSKMDIQPVQLALLFQEVYDLTYLIADDRNLKLRVVQPNLDLYVLVDPRRFRQVLINLVNAAIASMQEGTITLSAEPAAQPGYICVWVDDQCPSDARSEAIDLLRFAPTISAKHGAAIVPLTREQAIAQSATSKTESIGLSWLTSQILLQLMHGRLEVAARLSPPEQDPDGTTVTRIQCTIPLATE